MEGLQVEVAINSPVSLVCSGLAGRVAGYTDLKRNQSALPMKLRVCSWLGGDYITLYFEANGRRVAIDLFIVSMLV